MGYLVIGNSILLCGVMWKFARVQLGRGFFISWMMTISLRKTREIGDHISDDDLIASKNQSEWSSLQQ